MSIPCPACREPVPAAQINVSTDLAVCPACNESFRASEGVDAAEALGAVKNPPAGTWFHDEPDRIVVGASTRSPIVLFLIPFGIFWSGGSLSGIYGSQLAKGEFQPGLSLFGLPFLVGTIVLLGFILMGLFGRVEVALGSEGSKLFIGVGNLGWTRRFAWSRVRSVREELVRGRRGRTSRQIVLEGGDGVTLGVGLSAPRFRFMLLALRHLLTDSRFRTRTRNWA